TGGPFFCRPAAPALPRGWAGGHANFPHGEPRGECGIQSLSSRTESPMETTLRDLLRLCALAAAYAAALPALCAGCRSPAAVTTLILGGTGFTGPFQVRYALARGHKVTLFNRGKRPSPEWPGEVEQLHGDRETGDLSALRGRRWDVCIDNPTSLPSWVRDAGKVLRGNIGHYLFTSTISVYADGSRPGIDEDAPLAQYRGRDAMAETRQTLLADMEN